MISLPNANEPVIVLPGDVREVLLSVPSNSVHSVITSPPYWGVRDYGVPDQIGSEQEVEEYVAQLVSVFREIRRILKPDGVLWLNIANTYTSGNRGWRGDDQKNKGRGMSYRPPTPEGLKPKDLVGVAWKVAMGLQLDGWYLRNDIIWNKPNCQPESVKDRFTVAHEYIFMLSKSEKYFFDGQAVAEPTKDLTGTKNRRTVWNINTEPYPGAHFAVFPKQLVIPCLLASTRPGEIILDPFFGAGTVGHVALGMGRFCLGIEINEAYIALARERLASVQTQLLVGH